MSKQATAQNANEAPPQYVLMQMMTGYWVAKCHYVAAQLGVADVLRDGPKSVGELAEAAGAHADSLYRVLRALAGAGVFELQADGRFALNPLAEALQTGPNSARAMVLHLGEEPSWRAWGDLPHNVRTGETAFAHAHGMEVFPYYAQHPESAAPFNQAMTEYSEAVSAAVTSAYDFSQARKIVDVGGGHGGLMTAVLKANPSAAGVVFDLPAVAEGARGSVEAAGLTDRCEIIGGDFFESVPAGGDIYTLKTIIHDWDEARALTILRNVRRAMNPGGKLLLIETVIGAGPDPAAAVFFDVHMMVMTGGRERTEAEYAALYKAAGFRLTRVVPTATPVCLIEGVEAE